MISNDHLPFSCETSRTVACVSKPLDQNSNLGLAATLMECLDDDLLRQPHSIGSDDSVGRLGEFQSVVLRL